MNVEIRDGRLHLSGYVNAVERDSKVIVTKRGRCVEQIAAGAFAASLSDGHEVRMRFNHSRDIGSTADGVLSLREDNIGLYAEASTDDEELMALAGKGELRGWSFGFNAKEDEMEERSGKEPRRRVKALDLEEVSILSIEPAYDGTSVEYRSYEAWEHEESSVHIDKRNGEIKGVTEMHETIKESENEGSRTVERTITDKEGTVTVTETSTWKRTPEQEALARKIEQIKARGRVLEARAKQLELEQQFMETASPEEWQEYLDAKKRIHEETEKRYNDKYS